VGTHSPQQECIGEKGCQSEGEESSAALVSAASVNSAGPRRHVGVTLMASNHSANM